MKILIIGGHGTIGQRVSDHLNNKHEVLIASRSNSKLMIDISQRQSIVNLLEAIGPLDAIVNIAGEAMWMAFDDLSEEDYYVGIQNKLMGQVNLVQLGRAFLNPGGSITLTTGILGDDPVERTTSAAMVNGGIQSFVKAAALEMQNGLRLNVVSCGLVEDAYDKYKDYFPGYNAVPMQKVVNGYVRSIEGKDHGKIIRIY